MTSEVRDWKIDFPACPTCGRCLMVGRYGPNGWESKCLDCDIDYILEREASK